MNPKVKKGSFVLILVLLVLFVSLTAYSYILRIQKNSENTSKLNTQHETYFDHKLWFYSSNDILLGTYQCETTNCSYAKSISKDKDYAIDFYQSESKELPMINDEYAFISDFAESGSKAFIYNFKTNLSYETVTYNSVNNYGLGIQDNLFIVQNSENKYGVIQVMNNPSPIIPFEYDFIGLKNEINENNLIVSDYFIGLKDNEWFIIDRNNAELSNAFTNPIVTFNGKSIITKSSTGYQLSNYTGELVLPNTYKLLSFQGRFLNVIDQNNQFYVYDLNTEKIVSEYHTVKVSDQVSSSYNNNQLSLKLNDTTIETIEIS